MQGSRTGFSRVAVFGRVVAQSDGFTVLEMLVAVSILTSFAGLIGGSVYQVLSMERFWREEALATKELRRAGTWFSGDAVNAQQTDLVDGNPPADRVDLIWTGSDGVSHTSTYGLFGDGLVRVFDGVSVTVARDVASVDFSLASGLLTMALEVRSGPTDTESMSLRTYLRMLK